MRHEFLAQNAQHQHQYQCLYQDHNNTSSQITVPNQHSAAHEALISGRALKEVWKVIPCATPRIIRKCSRCSDDRFVSSDKFRVNANKKIIDIWLIYKCSACDFTLNQTIFSRTAVSKIDANIWELFLCNDKELAWKFAFDPNVMCGASIDWDLDFEIQRHGCSQNEENQSEGNQSEANLNILLKTDYFLKLPLFSILRQNLGLSRSALTKLEAQGKIGALSLSGKEVSLKGFIGAGCILRLSPGIPIPASLTLL